MARQVIDITASRNRKLRDRLEVAFNQINAMTAELYEGVDSSEGSQSNEQIDDRVSALIQDGTGISWSYNDAQGKLTPTVSLSAFSTTNLSEGTNLYYTQGRFDSAFGAKDTDDLSEGSNLYHTPERVRDVIAAALTEGANVTITVDDGADTITIAVSDLDGEDITLSTIGSPTYSNLQHLMNFVASSGRVSGGAISDAGGETVDVASGSGFIKAIDSDVAELMFFDWSASAGIAVATDTTVYIGVEYNSGSPQVVSRPTDDFDLDSEFPLGQVTNQGGDLHIINNPWWVGDGLTNVIERFQSEGTIVRDNRIGGLILGESGTRNVTLTSGTLWSRLTEFLISAIDTSGADTFTTSYRDGSGGWTNTTGVSQYPNTLYDDGSGTLATMTNNRYANLWFYIETDGNLVMLYPQAEHSNITGAENEQPPATIPDRIKETGILVGRILFIKGASSATDISSAFETVFTTTGVSDHGNLAGLTDDDHTQYHNDARALTWLGTRSTSDLSEGTNLYYTQGRVQTEIDSYVNQAFVEALGINITEAQISDLSHYTDENARDAIGAALVGGTDISVTVDDGADTITISFTGSAGGASNLADLNDVTITSIASGEILKWNGSAWINNTLAEAGIVPASGGTFTGDVAIAHLASDTPNTSAFSISDGGNQGFFFRQEAASGFIPTLLTETRGDSNDWGLFVVSQITPANDTGTTPIMQLDSRQNDGTAIETRPLLALSNLLSVKALFDKDGHLVVGGQSFDSTEALRIVGDSRFEGAGEVTGLLTVSVTGDGAEVLKLDTERAWSFYQKDTGSIASLVLRPAVDGKSFFIQNQDASTFVNFLTANDGSGRVDFTSDINVSGVGKFTGRFIVNPSGTGSSFDSTRTAGFRGSDGSGNAWVEIWSDDAKRAGLLLGNPTDGWRGAIEWNDAAERLEFRASGSTNQAHLTTSGFDVSGIASSHGIEVHDVVSGETYFKAGDGSPNNIIFSITRGSSNNVEFATFANDDYIFDGRVSGRSMVINGSGDRTVLDIGGGGTNTVKWDSTGYWALESSGAQTLKLVGLPTTSDAANIHINATEFIYKSTSSLRYKEDVETLNDKIILEGPYPSNSISEMLSKFRPIRFRDRNSKTRHIGFAAEDVHEIMPELCTYDEQGRPDWVQYPHLTALLVGGWQKHESNIQQLQAKVLEHEKEIADLKTRIAELS